MKKLIIACARHEQALFNEALQARHQSYNDIDVRFVTNTGELQAVKEEFENKDYVLAVSTDLAETAKEIIHNAADAGNPVRSVVSLHPGDGRGVYEDLRIESKELGAKFPKPVFEPGATMDATKTSPTITFMNGLLGHTSSLKNWDMLR